MMNAEQTKTKNENATKNRWLRGVGYLFGVSVLIAWGFAAHRSTADKAKYVVKDKYEQKISYAPIENNYDIHTMNFGKFYMDSMLYNSINIGDTILGRKSVLDSTNSNASYADIYNAFRLSNIFSINGTGLTKLDETYRARIRDAGR